MMTRRHLAIATTLLAIVLWAVAPFTASAKTSAAKKCPTTTKTKIHTVGTSSGQTVFEIGIEGGNIRPWAVNFLDNGSIQGNSWVTPHNGKLYDPPNALNGLLKLADAEG